MDHSRIAKAAGRIDLVGAPEGFGAMVMADLAKSHKGLILFIARDGPRANDFAEALKFFDPSIEQMRIPSWDCLPYDRDRAVRQGWRRTRMAALSRLARRQGDRLMPPSIVIATVRRPWSSACRREAAVAQGRLSSAKVGAGRWPIADLERYFAVNGYVRASTVSERGEFADARRRDRHVFSPGRRRAGAAGPVRRHAGVHPRLRSRDAALDAGSIQSVDLLPVS